MWGNVASPWGRTIYVTPVHSVQLRCKPFWTASSGTQTTKNHKNKVRLLNMLENKCQSTNISLSKLFGEELNKQSESCGNSVMSFVLLAMWETVKIFMVSYLKCSNCYCLYFELYQKLLQQKYYYVVMDNKRNGSTCCKRWIDCIHGFQNVNHSHLGKSDLLVGLQQCSLLHWNVLRINLVKKN